MNSSPGKGSNPHVRGYTIGSPMAIQCVVVVQVPFCSKSESAAALTLCDRCFLINGWGRPESMNRCKQQDNRRLVHILNTHHGIRCHAGQVPREPAHLQQMCGAVKKREVSARASWQVRSWRQGPSRHASLIQALCASSSAKAQVVRGYILRRGMYRLKLDFKVPDQNSCNLFVALECQSVVAGGI